MNRQLEIRLATDFPHVYGALVAVDKQADNALSLWGIQCGDGWYGILRSLGTAIDGACRESGEYAAQIKEKFGTLRVYLISRNPETNMKMNLRQEVGPLISLHPVSRDEGIRALVNVAIEKSSTTCERCGSAGSIGKANTMIAVLCTDCSMAVANKLPDPGILDRLIKNVIEPNHPSEIEVWRAILDDSAT
jgi:hypothetical protein